MRVPLLLSTFRGRYLVLVVASVLLLAACGGSASTNVSSEVLGPDPESTADLGSSGGSIEPITTDDLVARTGAVVEVKVLDVHRSRPNTADGTLPPIDTARGPEQLQRLYALTDVSLRIDQVVAAVAGWATNWQEGDEIDITLIGGRLTRILSPDEARALGVIVVDEEASTEEFEVEVYPDEPVDFESGSGLFEHLVEGDSVLLFLTQLSYPIFESSDQFLLITTSHPSGVFSRSDAGWEPAFPLEVSADPYALAERLRSP